MLTATGRAVAGAAVVLLALGLVLGYPEVIAIGVACVLALLVSVGWILLRPDFVAVRSLVPSRVPIDNPAVGRLTVTNRRSRRSSPVVGEETVGNRSVTMSFPSLAGGAEYTIEYPLPTDRRGIYPVGPLTIGQSDPLRLMTFGRTFAARSTLWVYPRVHRLTGLVTGRTSDMEGPTTSAAPQGGVAFHALREWVWGDDFRLIHWKSSARTGTLLVRQMVVPDEPRLQIVLDTSAAPYADDSFEDAVRAAASLVTAACLDRYPTVLRTTGDASTAVEDAAGLQAAMDLLAAVRTTDADPGLGALTRMLPSENDVSLIVITGRPAGAALAMVGRARPRFQLVTLVQLGPRPGRPSAPPTGVVGIDVLTSEDFCGVWNGMVRR